MNKIYGGLISSPANKIDTHMDDNRTTTFSGTIVETSMNVSEPIVQKREFEVEQNSTEEGEDVTE